MTVGEFFSFFVIKKIKIVAICLIYLQIASYFDTSETWKPLCFTLAEI